MSQKRKFSSLGKTGPADMIIVAVLGVIAFITIFPFYHVIIASFAEAKELIKNPMYLLPTSFDILSYKLIFLDDSLVRAFGVSVLVVVLGVALSMFCTVTAAYALSKQGVPGRNIIMKLIIFTMFFNGGMIPYFLQVKWLGLINKLPVLIISGAVSTIYLIIMKNYFLSFPVSIEESAKIDGANDIYILLRLVIPISSPIIATIGLFYAVDRWNDWWTPLLFISSSRLQPLVILLRKITVELARLESMGGALAQAVLTNKNPVSAKSVRMAVVVVSSVPIVVVYPFVQKYFTKGIMLGSLKG